MEKWDALWTNALLTTCENGYGFIKDAAIAVKDGKIAWRGPMHALPDYMADRTYNVNGRCITPGLIDCHTHFIFAGHRANEFEMRLQGKSYAEIAAAGGGIQSTVTATRAISEEQLLQQSLNHASVLLKSGVTTLEVKSGYGLNLETELKILRVAKKIESILPVRIYKTFLGAHAIPPEYRGKTEQYVDVICNDMIPKIANERLADAVDVFCEKIAFTLQQTEKIFQTAKRYNLALKCHSEQLSDSGSATLAAKYHALSCDHLEYISEEGVKAIADSNTVAVLLPGAFYFLQEKKQPPIHLLRESQVPIALASDCNPGTSPVFSLLLILNMACTLFKLTPEEALLGVTMNAAKALGLAHKIGTLTPGKEADFIMWDISHPRELAYFLGNIPEHQVVKQGLAVTLSNFS